MRISSHFDSGAVEVVDCADPTNIRLRLRADNAAAFRQWFHFRLQGAAGRRCTMHFENAGEAAYADGWPGYRAMASYDRRNWFRVPGTRYEGGVLTIEFTPEMDSVYLAYFEPYSWERHLDLLGRMDDMPCAVVSDLGATVDGRDLNLVTVGRPARDKKRVWIIARQHPGETMAEWFAEGLLERVNDAADPVARRILDLASVHVVPNMNPDGSVRGNLRTNAAGANLNREWLHPDAARSPEVLAVRTAMEAGGVDLFVDVHGDETLPYVFLDGAEMIPGVPPATLEAQWAFVERFAQASPDVQTVHGYAPDRFSDELLTLASKWVAHRFGCVSLTLEMPFKDNADLPDGVYGWSAARSKRLGAALLEPVLAHLLRE